MSSGAFRGQYALIQFCPSPARMEFLNVGLFLVVPDLSFSRMEFVDEPTRVEKLFGKQSKKFFDNSMESIRFRIEKTQSRDDFLEYFEEFSARRANQIRVTALLDVRIEGDPNVEFDDLFKKLVEPKRIRNTNMRARTRLRKTFRDFGIEQLLDKPQKIEIADYDLEVSAPYAYQNGHYNLIDAMSVTGNHAHDLREAGKKAIEGHFIARHSPLTRQTRLVIVADFQNLSEGFYRAIDEHFRDSDVKLYRYDHVDELVDDINKHTHRW